MVSLFLTSWREIGFNFLLVLVHLHRLLIYVVVVVVVVPHLACCCFCDIFYVAVNTTGIHRGIDYTIS